MVIPLMPPPPLQEQEQEQNEKKQSKMISSPPSSSSFSSSMAANDLAVTTTTTDHPVLLLDHETQSLDELLTFWIENDDYDHDNYLQNLDFHTATQFQELKDQVINDAQSEPSVLEPILESEFVNEIIASPSDPNNDTNFMMNPNGGSYPVTTTGDRCHGNSSLPVLNVVNNNDFRNRLISQEEEVRNAENFSNSRNYESSVQPINVWPPLPPGSSLINCICCQVLRDILHSNGIYTTKLEIHGKIGLICHAILEIRDEVNGSIDRQMIDFSTQSIEEVRQFLTHYCQERAQAGFVMLQDPLLTFYSALCAGANWNENPNIDDSVQPIQSETGVHQMSSNVEDDSVITLPKSSLAAQRERTGRLKLSDLVGYFHLPIEVAAKKLAICPTVLKKICRKHGMRRWPHRKIKSVDRQISSLRQSLREKNGEESAVAHTKIEMLKRERDRILNCIPK